jgi:pyrimidine operon attenuation protein/uracil phosphoribosyltransferase
MERPNSETLLDAEDIKRILADLAQQVIEAHDRVESIALVGIRTGGAFLAYRLQAELEAQSGIAPDTGVIDITLYRDDWTRLHNRPMVGRTAIEFPVEDRSLILVDDVLFTGRTTRAAMDALIDFGRPRRIELLVLIDRGGRELPIQPDFVGARLEAEAGQVIDVLMEEQGQGGDLVVKRGL